MSNKIKFILLTAVGILILLSGTVFISFKVVTEQHEDKSSLMFEELRNDIERLRTEKDTILQENQKLKADSLSYITLSTRLQNKQDQFLSRLKDAQKIIDTKEANLQRVKKRVEETEEQLQQAKDTQDNIQASCNQEKDSLHDEISTTQQRNLQQKALHQYNMGVAFIKAKLYAEAKDALDASLSINPYNADAHYNLGILFEHLSNDPLKAVLHYRKYLELNPEGKDREEVQTWITRLLQYK